MRESCASSASLSRPAAPGSSGKTMSRRLEEKMDALDDHGFLLCLAMLFVHSKDALLVNAFLSVELTAASSAQAATNQSSHA